MFHEEQVLNGVLQCRSNPNGEWRPSTAPHSKAVNELLLLTDERRMEVFRRFCVKCGCVQPVGRVCQC